MNVICLITIIFQKIPSFTPLLRGIAYLYACIEYGRTFSSFYSPSSLTSRMMSFGSDVTISSIKRPPSPSGSSPGTGSLNRDAKRQRTSIPSSIPQVADVPVDTAARAAFLTTTQTLFEAGAVPLGAVVEQLRRSDRLVFLTFALQTHHGADVGAT